MLNKEVVLKKSLNLLKSLKEHSCFNGIHSLNVNILSMYIGTRLDLNEEELFLLKISTLLHDIGKLNIPKEILEKVTPLTDAEYQLIKEHPSYSNQLIEQYIEFQNEEEKEFFSSVSYIIEQHHFSSNKKAFDKLTSFEKIVEIIKLADSIDAMYTKRPYNPKTKTIAEIREELNKGRNTQFCPCLVDMISPMLIVLFSRIS